MLQAFVFFFSRECLNSSILSENRHLTPEISYVELTKDKKGNIMGRGERCLVGKFSTMFEERRDKSFNPQGILTPWLLKLPPFVFVKDPNINPANSPASSPSGNVGMTFLLRTDVTAAQLWMPSYVTNYDMTSA